MAHETLFPEGTTFLFRMSSREERALTLEISLLHDPMLHDPMFEAVRVLAPFFAFYFLPCFFVLLFVNYARLPRRHDPPLLLPRNPPAPHPPHFSPCAFAPPTLRSISLCTQNVHDLVVEIPAFRTFSALARSATSSPTFSVFLQLVKLRLALSRKSPAGLPKSVASAALQALRENSLLDRSTRMSDGSERTLGFVIAVVYRAIESHSRRKDLERRLAEEIVDGAGFCVRGRVGRVINALRGGFGIIENEFDVDMATFRTSFVERVVSNKALKTRRAKEKSAIEVLDEFGVFDATRRKEWIEQALERGSNA